MTGSVDRSYRSGGNSGKDSGVLKAKSHSLWSSRLNSYQSGSRNGANRAVEDDGNHAFIKLPENGHADYVHTDIGASDLALTDIKKDNGIQVRTDVYVENEV